MWRGAPEVASHCLSMWQSLMPTSGITDWGFPCVSGCDSRASSVVTQLSAVSRYRAGVADLLAKSITMTRGIENEMNVACGREEANALHDLNLTPGDPRPFDIALLLRKARLHAVAVHRANHAGNLHSLGVQMRPALECVGQLVFKFHNLLIVGGEEGLKKVFDFDDASAYRYIIAATKGDIGHRELLEMASSVDAKAAAAVGVPRVGTEQPGRKSIKQADKVAILADGKGWYDHLSERFCHGRCDWTGLTWEGGVVSNDTILDEFTFAIVMDYLARQVALMNAHVVLWPVDGVPQIRWEGDRVDATLALLHEVREASHALRAAATAAFSGSDTSAEG